jgi:nitric oxide reductase subunit B
MAFPIRNRIFSSQDGSRHCWSARSQQFIQQPIVDLLVWMRVPDDIVFSVGALAFAWFVVSLWVRTRREPHEIEAEDRKLEVAPSKRAA